MSWEAIELPGLHKSGHEIPLEIAFGEFSRNSRRFFTGVARDMIALFREVRPPERADYHLTPHETRLLKLFVEGHNYKTAAAELRVSINTVNFHVRSIYDKLQVHSRSEAVVNALVNRLV